MIAARSDTPIYDALASAEAEHSPPFGGAPAAEPDEEAPADTDTPDGGSEQTDDEGAPDAGEPFGAPEPE